jgi:Asp-tRNA(Asn)/Glu-tRNA(Gln) amidotransferase A subunit family amidase
MTEEEKEKNYKISKDDISKAEIVAGLQFTNEERDLLFEGVNENLENYLKLRKLKIENHIPPALYFKPVLPGMKFPNTQKPIKISPNPVLRIPENLEEIAFWPIKYLSQLVKEQKITSLDLTKMYLKRLKKYDPILKCCITITEELALTQAKRADEEINDGHYRSGLHGIPYGVKDLFAYPNFPTTWGATPYKEQVINETATVIKQLEDAGAVMLGKMTLGALAWGDVWFGGQTKSPWNIEEGSSGSSAGSAAAVAAGLVGFAIGTETYGSIISPSTKCGTTGLRPTFGRVSRFGAMALSWSMDKIGPICRTVEDCAIVFDIIKGPDGKDQTVMEIPFNWDYSFDVLGLRVGYLKTAFEEEREYKAHDDQVLTVLRSIGINLIPIELPEFPVEALSIILSAEAATAFDELTLSNRDDELVRQVKDAWPNEFRQSRLIPAVEYIKANRARTMLMQEMENLFQNIDVYVAPSFCNSLLLTNLTGHPAVVVPNGFIEIGIPTSITFTGNLYKEEQVLALAKAYQDKTDFHKKRPSIESNKTQVLYS